VGDTLALAHLTDGMAIVAAVGATRRGAFEQTVDRLQTVNGKVVGAILNRTEGASRYGEYGYGYGTRTSTAPRGQSPHVSEASGSARVGDLPVRDASPVST
jgi:Mrp family chromosome partitioning ATPase